jgi:hypothetical protein
LLSLERQQVEGLLVGLFAECAIPDKPSAALTIENVTDEKYIASLYREQGCCGAPRHSQLTVSRVFWRI